MAFAGFMLLHACSDVGMPRESLESDKLSSMQIMDENVVEGDAAHQEEANMKITKLHEWFGQTESRSGETATDYPAYYGGSFITPEGKLIVYIAGDVEKNKQEVISVIGESGVEFRPAENSYATLNERMKILRAYVNSNRESPGIADVVMLSLRDMEDKIVVLVLHLNENKKRFFRGTPFDHPAIELQNVDRPFVDQVTLNPGGRIDGPPGGYWGSIAFRALDANGQRGFVTTGHLFSIGGSAYRYGNVVGTVTHNKNNGSVDAAFVRLSNPSADYVTNTIDGTSNQLSVSTSLPGIGTTINLRGAKSGSRSGTIIGTDADFWIGSVHFTNMTEATYASTNGDSGGVIYSYISSTGTRRTVGIHKGRFDGGNGNSMYSKASEVLSAFIT